MKNWFLILLKLTLVSGFGIPLATLAQGSAFTYQGRLTDGAGPANGTYDLRFLIYDASVGGNQQGPILTNSATSVSNGLFTVTLDFGNQFPGADRWLDIAVRTNGAGAFFTLAPRQPLTPAPYAITAGNVASGGLLSGIYSNALTFSNSANTFGGAFNGNGSGLTNLNAVTLNGLTSSNFWKTTGNSGTTPGANFIGTADNQPLELRVNGARSLRLEPNASGAPNVIAGAPVNLVSNGVVGATISGGGSVCTPTAIGTRTLSARISARSAAARLILSLTTRPLAVATSIEAGRAVLRRRRLRQYRGRPCQHGCRRPGQQCRRRLLVRRWRRLQFRERFREHHRRRLSKHCERLLLHHRRRL